MIRLLPLLALLIGTMSPAHAERMIFACEPEWASLTRELMGDTAEIYEATSANQDPHHIEARPSLISAVRRADLLVCNGAELETGWLPVLLRESGNADIQPGTAGYFEAAAFVQMLDVPETLDRADGDVHASGNPHVHLDPRNIALVADALAKVLTKRFPDQENDIKARHTAFSAKWQSALDDWENRIRPLRGKSVVVQHENWRYFTHWSGMKLASALEPKPGIPPSAKHLSAVLKMQQQSPAEFIMIAHYEDTRGAEWLSEKTTLAVKKLPYTVGAQGTKTLFDLFDHLVTAVTAEAPQP